VFALSSSTKLSHILTYLKKITTAYWVNIFTITSLTRTTAQALTMKMRRNA